MRLATGAVLIAMLMGSATTTRAQMASVSAPSDLKPYNVTVRRFDIGKGLNTGTDFVLPVDSPDAEHA